MILTAIILLFLAAALGLWLVVLGTRYHRGSLPLSIGHAIIAVSGLGVLGVQVLEDPAYKLYNVAALLLMLTLLGGLVLLALRLSKHEHRTPPPMFIVSLHAIIAAIALLLLVVGYVKQ